MGLLDDNNIGSDRVAKVTVTEYQLVREMTEHTKEKEDLANRTKMLRELLETTEQNSTKVSEQIKDMKDDQVKAILVERYNLMKSNITTLTQAIKELEEKMTLFKPVPLVADSELKEIIAPKITESNEIIGDMKMSTEKNIKESKPETEVQPSAEFKAPPATAGDSDKPTGVTASATAPTQVEAPKAPEPDKDEEKKKEAPVMPALQAPMAMAATPPADKEGGPSPSPVSTPIPVTFPGGSVPIKASGEQVGSDAEKYTTTSVSKTVSTSKTVSVDDHEAAKEPDADDKVKTEAKPKQVIADVVAKDGEVLEGEHKTVVTETPAAIANSGEAPASKKERVAGGVAEVRPKEDGEMPRMISKFSSIAKIARNEVVAPPVVRVEETRVPESELKEVKSPRKIIRTQSYFNESLSMPLDNTPIHESIADRVREILAENKNDPKVSSLKVMKEVLDKAYRKA